MNSSLKILVVDDSEDDVFMLRRAFTKAGQSSSVQTVGDGTAAVAFLRGDAPYHDRERYPFPDIILLDVNMPGISGFDVLKWIRHDSRCKFSVVHIMTTSNRAVDVLRAAELHANSYVVKPSRMDVLTDFVTTLHQWHRFACLPTVGGDHKLAEPPRMHADPA